MSAMKTALGTIQQTLTPEAATVLSLAVSEASRRSHGQTTPLHVAAALLSAPSGELRRACVRSHANTTHPLQCRALELCFSVALDRLPSSTAAGTATEPPISNALMAALKRAQAHQRRGCPEQQQQPLLAVKVELEHLLVSILDDPSVSRVMREASFSSTAVKAAVEQSIAVAPSAVSPAPAPAPAVAPSPYLNPRLLPGSAARPPARVDEATRVMDVMTRSRKRNPVLVGDSEPEAVVREVFQRIESGGLPTQMRAVKVVSFAKELAAADRSQTQDRIRQLGGIVDGLLGCGSGVVVDVGDLKWVVESPNGAGIQAQATTAVTEAGRAAVAEVTEMLRKFRDVGSVWIVGTASCATYLRCQVYFPAMENDWDIQAVPIAPRAPFGSVFSKIGGNGILSSSVGTLSPMKNLMTLSTAAAPLPRRLEAVDSSKKKPSLCSSCMDNYEKELAKLVAQEFEKSSQTEEADKKLPQWLQRAKLSKGDETRSTADKFQSKEQELKWKQSTEELMARWHDKCSQLHSTFSPALLASEKSIAPGLSTQLNLTSSRISAEPKLQLNRDFSLLQPKNNLDFAPLERKSTCPSSPVKTDLVLWNTRLTNSSLEKPPNKEHLNDRTEHKQDEFSSYKSAKLAGVSDIDTYKHLVKGLIEKVAWQQEAAAAIATAVTNSRFGNRRNTGRPRGDTWILFVGPDRVGKKKMASALSETLFGTGPTTVSFGSCNGDSDGKSNVSARGRTSISRVVEAVRQNPFSIIVLEDIDQADGLVRETIKQAMDKGRLSDSYSRDVSLGSVIFILTTSWVPQEVRTSYDSMIQCEEKLLNSAYSGWQLELSAGDNPGKRRPDWQSNARPSKARKESVGGGLGLSLDLNLSVGLTDNEAAEGSRNSSDLTVDHEHEKFGLKCTATSAASELIELVENTILFKPVDFSSLRKNISDSIATKFTAVMGSRHSVKVDDDALDQIVAAVWLTGAAFNDWAERVLVPSLNGMNNNLRMNRDGFLESRLSVVKGEQGWRSNRQDLLPSSVTISVEGI